MTATHLPLSLPLLARVLDHLLALRRRGVAPALAEHLAAFGRQLLEAVKVLAHPRLVAGGECLEFLPARAQRLALLRGKRSPVRETVARLIALVRRHPEPALAAVSERLLALGRQRVPLSAETRQQPLLVR